VAAFLLVVSPIQQNNDQDRLYADFRFQLRRFHRADRRPDRSGAPVACLAIPG